jgi:hypothetical protein
MRMKAPVCCAILVALAACSSEQVKSDYMGPAAMTQDQILEMLTAHGYTEVTGLHKNGEDWVGAANKDGQPVNFDIDKKGTIRNK